MTHPEESRFHNGNPQRWYTGTMQLFPAPVDKKSNNPGNYGECNDEGQTEPGKGVVKRRSHIEQSLREQSEDLPFRIL